MKFSRSARFYFLLLLIQFVFVSQPYAKEVANTQELTVSAFGNLPDISSVKLSPDGKRAIAVFRSYEQLLKATSMISSE